MKRACGAEGTDLRPLPGWAEIGLASCFFLVVSVWWLWPLPVAPNDHLLYLDQGMTLVGADADLMLWVLSWGAHAITSQPLDLFSANIFYPAPLSLAYSEHLLGQLPLFAPTYWLTGNAVLAANFLILAAHTLSGLGMYLLTRRWAPASGALLAGFLFSFQPYRLFELGHFYLLSIQWLPLGLLFAERVIDHARKRDALVLALFVLLQLLSSFYLAYATVFALAAYLPVTLWWRRRELDRRRWFLLGGALLAAVLPFGLTALPYLRLRELGIVLAYDETAPPYTLFAFSTANALERLLRVSGPGPVAYAFALISLLPPFRKRAPMCTAAVALIATGLFLALGPTISLGGNTFPSPYRLLQEWLPGFSSVRVPIRLALVAQIGLALLVASGFGRIARWLPRPGAMGLSFGAMLLTVWTFQPLPSPPLQSRPVGEGVPEAYRWLARNGEGRPLLEWPRGRGSDRARRMYLSTVHWLPIVEAYTAYPPDFPKHVHHLAWGLPGHAALERVTDVLDIGWILVDLEKPGQRERWQSLPRGLEVALATPEHLVLRVRRKAPIGAVERLRSGRTSLAGVPLERLDRCRGSIELERPLGPWPDNQVVPFRIRVSNEEPYDWPGASLLPRHVVRASVCLADRDAPFCTGPQLPLPGDVPAHGALSVPLWARTPGVDRPLRLDVALIQVGDGPLAECGLAPLSIPIEIAGQTDSGVRAPKRKRSLIRDSGRAGVTSP